MRRISAVALLIVLQCLPIPAASLAGEQTGIPPEIVANYLHAVIEADRTFYTIHVVERLQRSGVVAAAENWRSTKNTLPLPAQFLMESSALSAMTGTSVRYRLISLWPINPLNVPRSAAEKAGLESLRTHPEQVVTGTVTQGSETYFQAIYADRAVSQSCVGCHNTHPQSAKKDFKLNEAMGGLVIEIPMGR
ncbi:MAG: DUF3365 domain-containing protein [Nitrospira sp.]|nr:DUF3365 domain-containing protein [Nitrospira sp.]